MLAQRLLLDITEVCTYHENTLEDAKPDETPATKLKRQLRQAQCPAGYRIHIIFLFV